MVLPPRVAPFASSNRSFVRDSRARELAKKSGNRSSFQQGGPLAVSGASSIDGTKASSTTAKAQLVKDVPLPPSLDRSFVKHSRLKQRQAAESSNLSLQEGPTASSTSTTSSTILDQDVKNSNITEKATATIAATSSSMMSAQDSIYQDLLLASEDRSFLVKEEAPALVLPNRGNNIKQPAKANLSFPGLPSSTKLTTDSKNDVSLTHSLPPAVAAASATAKATNSSINRGNNHHPLMVSTATTSGTMTPPLSVGQQSYYASSSSTAGAANRGSSFWAEWAASEDVENVVAMLNMTVDPSLDVTTASSTVAASTAKNTTTAAGAAVATGKNNLPPPKEEIDAVADVLFLGSSREEVYHDDDEDTGAAEHERNVIHNQNNNNFNTSVNTFAALNITHATVDVSALAATAVDETAASDDLSVCGQAMEDSNAATQLLVEKEYEAALEKFQRAVRGYEGVGDASLVATVNRAGCHRNMATAHRALERYGAVGRHLEAAQDLYLHCRDQLERKNEQAVLTLDGQLLENSKVAGDVSQQQAAVDEYMCLDEMILETLQTRATFYIKYQDDIEQAVECHEQALKRLLQINRFKHWEAMSEYLVLHEGITFTPLPKDRHTLLLTKSLEALGKLYRTIEPGASNTPCLIVYEDALDVLQSRMEQEDPDNDAMIHSVAKILRCLSEVYFQRKELDRAVDALHDSTAVKLRASGEPCAESLAVMDKMGGANEKMKNWAKALLCYEQTLLARSKFYGNTNIQVATSLVNVARVMELKDGTSEESLDLFRAANAIFALQSEEEAELERLSSKEDAETILQTIPSEMRQGHYEKAVEQLNKCLALSDESDRNVSLDRAQIFFDLGRAYMNMNDFQKASECLMEAVREAGNGLGEEQVAAMMQNFEFLLPGGAKSNAKDEEEDDAAAAEGEDTFEDPPLSLHSINLEMEKEDEQEQEKILERSYRDRMTKIEMLETSTNPHHQILYESFVQEEGPRSPQFRSAKHTAPFRGTVRRTLRERVWTEKNRQLPAKIAKKLSDKVKALQKKKLPKKLKKLGTKYWKRAFDRKTTTMLPHPFRCVVSTEASLMVIEEGHEEHQLPNKTNNEDGEFKVVGVAPQQPAARRVRSVLIEEEMNGFSVQAR